MRARTALGLVLVVTSLLFAVAPAYASGKGGSATPDLAIKKLESRIYLGAGVIAPDGSGEMVARTIRQGRAGSFNVKLQNPASGTLTATLKGCRPDAGFIVKYFKGNTDISKSVKAGTLTVTLAAGQNIVIRVDVHAGATTPVGRVQVCPVNVLQSATIIDTVIGEATVRH